MGGQIVNQLRTPMKQPDQHDQNVEPEPVIKNERRYWRVVNLISLLFAAMVLLAMYLLLGPNFWKEFFK